VDVNGVLEFHRGQGLALRKHEVSETNVTLEQALPMSDVVITGVPTPSYKVDTALLKEGVVAVNFSSFPNFNEDVKMKASLYVPSVGKVTVTMLERNLCRLYDYQLEDHKKE
jgi:methylenetetrahydrofolate dehydrogenase (NAD+)